jgi:hypothetical protein
MRQKIVTLDGQKTGCVDALINGSVMYLKWLGQCFNKLLRQ